MKTRRTTAGLALGATALGLAAGCGSAASSTATTAHVAGSAVTHTVTVRPKPVVHTVTRTATPVPVQATQQPAAPAARPTPQQSSYASPEGTSTACPGINCTSPPTQPAPAQQANAVAVVLQFYQDITNQDYQAAWALGGDNLSGGVGYSAWVAGYSTTASISLATYGQFTDSTVWADLDATQTSGSVTTYYGTYTVTGGIITGAHIAQTS
jgi:hypothetical protein